MKIEKSIAVLTVLALGFFGFWPNLLQAQGTRTDNQIAYYQQLIRRNPGNAKTLFGLGDALIRKARETGDPAYFRRAEEALKRSLEIAPKNAGAMRHLAYVFYSRHEFEAAADHARKAIELNPSDGDSYGVLGDALLEVGEYGRAEEVYKKMMELEENLYSYSRLAGLKSVRGDSAGAIVDLERAIAAGKAAKQPAESIAWAEWQLGSDHFVLGKLENAESYYRQSLETYPNYYRALAGMAQVRGAQKNYSEAIRLYQKAIGILPMPDFAAALGDIYIKIGKPELGKQQYELVEYIGRLNSLNQALYNRELAYFYTDHDMKLAESLELAKRELDYRKDIYAYDLLAWSLYKNDKVEEARDAIEKALKLGTQDAKLFFHAGMIYHRLGEKEKAKQYLAKAIGTNPHFHILYAETAQKTLEQLQQPTAQAGMELRGSGEGRMINARAIITILLAAWILIVPNSATAHPLGNFSISHYSGIRVSKDAIELRYLIDMAEIPTFQEIQESGIVTKAGDPSLEAYLTRKSELLRDGLKLEVNGQSLLLWTESKEIIFPPGAGDLPTMKIGILFKAKLGDAKGGEYLLSYRDGNFSGRAGWKEIIAIAEPGARILNSSVPETDRSSQLNNYPTDLLDSPPQELEAKVAFTTAPGPAPVASTARSRVDEGGAEKARAVSKFPMTGSDASQRPNNGKPVKQPAPEPRVNSGVIEPDSPRANENSPVQLQANRQATPLNSFTELMATEQLGLGIILIALAVAVGLGAFHALEPGHGKTLVAAYLVGSRGTVKHALLLGLIVTAAHTAGVYLLGAVTLYASQYIVPERLYPWLGVVSGVMIACLGAVLLVRRYRGKDGILSHHHHDHANHSHGSDHHHHHHHPRDHGHSHHHGHTHEHHGLNRQVSPGELLALGISGGIVPCPAALVVLLSAVSMQRIGFGLLLIVAFSVGLAAVLIAIGLLMVYARDFMSRFQANGRLFTRWLPLASSTIITLFGFGMIFQSVASAGYFVG